MGFWGQIRFFKSKIYAVKDRVKTIKREAYLAKIDAQKELDRLEFLAGNQGYVKKDYEWTDPTPKGVSFDDINIDVKFVK